MTEEELQEIRRMTRQLRAERGQERIHRALSGIRNSMTELYQVPGELAKIAMKAGLSAESLVQAMETLNKIQGEMKSIQGAVLSASYHVAEEALGINEDTQDMANALTPILAERAYLEGDPKTIVAVLRAVEPETFEAAKALLLEVEPEKFRLLFGDLPEAVNKFVDS